MVKTILLEKLKQDGVRITKTRKSLIDLFTSSERPVSALDLLNYLSKKGTKVNKTTVYRELKFLLNQEIIKEIYISPGEIHYESSKLEHHHHLVCEKCGKVDPVVGCTAETWEKNIARKKDFLVKSHSLEFFGLCHNCH